MTAFQLLAAATLVFGCAAATPGQTQMNDPIVTLTEADDGRTVNLRVGQTVSVTLPENATTGYRWAVDAMDPDFIAAAGEQSSYPGGAIGSAGSVTWSFTARAPGSTTVTLKRWRHWEGDASIVQRFRLGLVVAP